MSKFLVTGTFGPEDPTRASMPFHIAKGAKEAGYDPEIVLTANAAVIVQEAVHSSLQGVGMPSLKELMQFATTNNLRIYV